MTLTWNLITKHLNPHEQLQAKIRQKISKLETHLQHFPPETVHLLVQLERHPKREDFTAALTLRLPSNILHSRKKAMDPIAAFDKSVKALMRELSTLKAELRREKKWIPKEKRKIPRGAPTVQFTSEPHPDGPKSLADTLAHMIQKYYGRLLYHVQRELWRAQMAERVPKGAITAQAVVDEVAQQALSKPQRKPDDISYRFWLFALARKELRRRYRALRKEGKESVPLDEPIPRSNAGHVEEGYDVEDPIPIDEDTLEAREALVGESLPDERTASPDAVAMEKDLISVLHQLATSWPPHERAVFELHFMEGFEADEVAMLEGLKVPETRALITQVQSRLKELLRQTTDRWLETQSEQRITPLG